MCSYGTKRAVKTMNLLLPENINIPLESAHDDESNGILFSATCHSKTGSNVVLW